jgi:hypothetical protein
LSTPKSGIKPKPVAKYVPNPKGSKYFKKPSKTKLKSSASTSNIVSKNYIINHFKKSPENTTENAVKQAESAGSRDPDSRSGEDPVNGREVTLSGSGPSGPKMFHDYSYRGKHTEEQTKLINDVGTRQSRSVDKAQSQVKHVQVISETNKFSESFSSIS